MMNGFHKESFKFMALQHGLRVEVMDIAHPFTCSTELFRLQAILEIITNVTSMALALLAQTNTQLRTAV